MQLRPLAQAALFLALELTEAFIITCSSESNIQLPETHYFPSTFVKSHRLSPPSPFQRLLQYLPTTAGQKDDSRNGRLVSDLQLNTLHHRVTISRVDSFIPYPSRISAQKK